MAASDPPPLGDGARPLADADILAQIPAARARGVAERRHGLRAAEARYSAARHQLTIGLTNGTAIAIPVVRVPALRGASAHELARVEVTPTGSALHWERLDVDLSVPALVRDALGGSAVMSVLGAAGGTVTSARKAEAARANGANGGRPRGAAKPKGHAGSAKGGVRRGAGAMPRGAAKSNRVRGRGDVSTPPSLSGTVLRYDAPTEPAIADGWEPNP